MPNIIVLFEITIKDGKLDDYLARAAKLKDSLKMPMVLFIRNVFRLFLKKESY